MREMIEMLEGDPRTASYTEMCRYSLLMFESAADTSDPLLVTMCNHLLYMTQMCVQQSLSRTGARHLLS